jgi:hypothetical protein
VKILSCGEQDVSFDEEEKVSDNSRMQHGIWATTFLFTSKTGINVDSESPRNTLEYFELFCIPEIAEVIAAETNQYAKNFLENMPNLKLRPITGRR